MTRHLFGGTWSSRAANFALKRTGKEFIDDCSVHVTSAVQDSFYVDDLFHSNDTKEEAIATGKGLQQMLKRRGFNLTKWGSNDKEIISAFDAKDRAKGIKSLDLQDNVLPSDRALGLTWNPDTDKLQISA